MKDMENIIETRKGLGFTQEVVLLLDPHSNFPQIVKPRKKRISKIDWYL